MSLVDSLRRLRQFDNARPSFAGEHWLVMGAGLALLAWSRRSRTTTARRLATTAGYALLARAASGRDGVRRLASKRGFRSG